MAQKLLEKTKSSSLKAAHARAALKSGAELKGGGRPVRKSKGLDQEELAAQAVIKKVRGSSKKITTSSTAEYFSKNLQQVGFSSPTKAVLTKIGRASCRERG